MYPLIKQNLLITSAWSYVTILIIIAFSYIVTLPPIFSLLIIVMSLLITLFYYDDKNKVNPFLISLPIAKKSIVQSRYVTMVYLSIMLLFYQWLLMFLFSTDSHYIYNWRDAITVISILLIMNAIYIPIYYLLRSPHVATGVVLIIFFIVGISFITPLVNVLDMNDFIIFNDLDAGFHLLVERYIPFFPYLFFPIIALGIFYTSMKITERIYIYKDRDY